FLSADPFVQDSTNLQALNRYSYVQNNPLSYTDPSGYFLKGLIKKWGKALKSAVSAVIEFERELRRKILRSLGKIEGLSTVISIGLTMMGCPYCAVAFNAAMTDANGGTIGQVLTGVAIGFIASGIPGNESGSFWDGGLGARIASGLGGGAPGNIGASLFIGGSIAKAQGGKFIDGVKGAAVTMGIAYGVSRIMNSVSEPADVQDSKNSGGMPNRAGAEKAVNEMYENGELSTDMTFDTRDEAAKYFGDKLYSVTAANNIELGAQLIHKGGVWTIGEIQFGALNAEGTHYVSVRGPYGIHTHPPGSQEFPSNHDASQVQYKDEPLRPYKGLYTVGSTGITYCGSRCGRLGSSAYERVK
ncbi:MAG: hypothetical protein M0Q95_20900, partial [Porticoccaceae bacterium]|nr:hypothetical protein [Porticoccaceae bacterium]